MATQTIDFTARQREEHAADEAIIQAGMGVFVEVGHALVRIRERKSYLLTHSTFDEYLADRWGLSYHYAWEVMAAAQAARLIEAQEGLPAPANARVAYELRPLLDEPKRLVAVWRSLIEDGGRPTAQTVRKAVRALRSRPREYQPVPDTEPEPNAEQQVFLDALDAAVEALSRAEGSSRALRTATPGQLARFMERSDAASHRARAVRAMVAQRYRRATAD